MAKQKRRKKPEPIQIIGPTEEQLSRGVFVRANMAYRRVPVIETLLKAGKITQRQFDALSYYREQERMMVETVSLKPCPNPWCNSHKTEDDEIRAMERPIVEPSRASFELRVSCPVCPLNTPWFDTEAEAITAWNTRASEAHTLRVAEAVREA